MKLYKIVFLFFIFVATPSLYSLYSGFNPKEAEGVLHKRGAENVLYKQGARDDLHTNLSVSDQKLVTKTTFQYLNQGHFGTSEYEKAQKELKQFNRPVMGIVGQDHDQISYREYQKKVLGSTY